MKRQKTTNKNSTSTEIRVSGTSPFSFELSPGAVLSVKELSAARKNRPSIGSKLTKSSYLLFSGVTKVGKLSNAALNAIGSPVPADCKVVHVDEAKKVLVVAFNQADD